MDDDEVFVVLFILSQTNLTPGNKPIIRKIGVHDVEYDAEKKRYSQCKNELLQYNEKTGNIVRFGLKIIEWDSNNRLIKFGVNPIAYDRAGRTEKLGIHKFKYELGKIVRYGIHPIEYGSDHRIRKLGPHEIFYTDDEIDTKNDSNCCVVL